MLSLPGAPHQGGTLTGTFRRHRVGGELKRNITVMLPPSYEHAPERQYPVIYLQDGQNMFDRREGFMGREWHADEIALGEMASGRMEEAILVAVDHGQADRLAEYSPARDPELGGGRADQFLDFLTGQVDPLIRSSYRTDNAKAGIVGSSMGGLVSLYAAFRHPEMFGTVGALSPSLWWAEGHLARALTQHQGEFPERVWLDIGDQEGSSDTFGEATLGHDGVFSPTPDGPNGVQDVRDRVREMAQTLRHLGLPDFHYEETPGATHDEASWSQRLGRLFRWMLPA